RVVWIVPEVNLADWEGCQPAPWLPGGGSARWHAELAQGRTALAAGRTEETLAAAAAMRDLDGGLVPTAHRLEVRAHLALGQEAAAATAARGEIAAQHYPLLAHLAAPQASPWVQELLRRGGHRHGFSIVDLPEVFAAHGDTALPGRRYFLDYCHLTVEGIHVAMAAATAAVLSQNGETGEWRRLVETLPPPVVDPSLVATAYLGAAIHGAHRLLPLTDAAPLLEFWCGAALDASPRIADTFLDLARARCAPVPAVLTGAQRRNLASSHRLGLQHGWRWDGLDLDVLAALATALEARGIAARERVREDLVAGRGSLERPVDLVETRWLWRPLERFLPEVMAFDDLDRRAFYRAPWPRSSFALVTDGAGAVRLRCVLRLPAAGGAARRSVGLEVDGREIARRAVGSRFERWDLELPAAMMHRGVHRLTLLWPPAPPRGGEALALALRRLEEGLEGDLHPVFGEVFSLEAAR
ncbi:MAG: hypothetical protein KDD11_22515, partial [Acidobacteria bacterium]|nr:hypothetical protein [Acidobacteriota bacterium]